MGLTELPDEVVRAAAEGITLWNRADTRYGFPGFLHLLDQAQLIAGTECREFDVGGKRDDDTLVPRNLDYAAIVRQATRSAVETGLAALIAAEQARADQSAATPVRAAGSQSATQ